MDTLATLSLLAATLAAGSGGYLALYAYTVMPGLAATDARAFFAAFSAFSAIDRPSATRGSWAGFRHLDRQQGGGLGSAARWLQIHTD
jgi:hypothetical protein